MNTSNQPPSTKPAALTRAWDFLRHPHVRFVALVLIHAVLFSLIFFTSYSARYDFALPAAATQLMLTAMPIVVATKILVFYFSSHFHGWWRYVTFSDVMPLLRASLLAMFVVAFVDYFLVNHIDQIPRAVIVIDTLLTILVIGGLRSVWRLTDETFGTAFKNHQAKPALLVGTDHLAGRLVGQINANPAMPYRIKALIAKTPNFPKRFIAGLPVVGSIDDVVEVAAKHNIDTVLIPSGTVTGPKMRELMTARDRLTVRILPRFEDTMAGADEIPLREINIEDLLKRDPVRLDTKRLSSFINQRRILVTGAGGSIGSEICRQLIEFAPSELILLGRGENRIYSIHQELQQQCFERKIKLTPVIGNITDENRMDHVFKTYQPEIVFHAAAHKHVPLMELHAAEALRNNVLGTNVVVGLADRYACSHFVMVSTDKAVNPTSMMGASKYLAERTVHAASQNSSTKICVVRFGNVLGSAGSVVPLFQKQIKAGGPITVTDPRMTRYFMSIPEASQLVLQAGCMSDGGEIFVLDMGEPVQIMQLAHDLIELSGLPAGGIDIQVTGTRDGEKLYEELYFDDEELLPTEHDKVRAAYQRPFEETPIAVALDQIRQSISAGASNDQIKGLVRELVPEFHDHLVKERIVS